MRKQWSTVLLIVLLLIVVMFSVLNVDPVNINFGFTMLEMPLVVVIIGTLLIGVLMAVIWSTTIVMRERSKIKKLNHQLDQLNVEQDENESRLKAKNLEEQKQLQDRIDQLTHEKKELSRRISNLEMSRVVEKNGHRND